MADGTRDSAEVPSRETDELVVRDATPDDALALASLVGELGYPAAHAQIRERLRRLSSDRVLAIVATEAKDGDLLGLCTVHLLSTIHADGDVAQLTALVVSERSRGRGVGRRLVAAAERWARARGAARIVVTTALHRSGAHAFYERLGYGHTGRRYGRALA